MSDPFMETLMEHLVGAIPDSGNACAREDFIIYRPLEMTNEEWEAWKDELRTGFGEDPGSPDTEASSSATPF